MLLLHSNFTKRASFMAVILIRFIECTVGTYCFGPPCVAASSCLFAFSDET